MMRITLSLCGSPAAIAQFLTTVPAALLGGNGPAPFPGIVHDDSGAIIGNAAPAMPFIPAMPTGNDEGGDDTDDDSDDDAPASGDAPAVDSTGLPWDERIHAKPKVMVAGDKWRKRKGVQAATVQAVEAELRARLAATPAPMAMPAIQMPPIPMPMMAPPALAPAMPHIEAAVAQMPVMAMPPALAAAPIPMPMPALAAAPIPMPMPEPVAAPMPVPTPMPMPEPVAAPAPAPAPAGEMDMAGFMAHLTTLMQQGRVVPDDLIAVVSTINSAFAPHGHAPLGAITDVGSDPQKLAYAVQVLQANGKW